MNYFKAKRKKKYEMKICTSKCRKVFARSRVEYVIERPKFLNFHNVFKLVSVPMPKLLQLLYLVRVLLNLNCLNLLNYPICL